MEEEWASRQRVLQIQAEEAQQLRREKQAQRRSASDREWRQKPNIINVREKLKETDEYKRAMEEEWASRMRELKIQAEEARLLRKKQNAERKRRQKPNIIDEREKMKETDEYKRAMEEEWASRQRQLQLQAEEARQLRKKKKAERKRADMERRQKERVEEMRETQKKEEENRNLKAKLRDEVMKELENLETTCTDMASLLHALGIHASNGVRGAYKKALLRFHPDKASKTDIKLQVEAEEKFKLLHRMSEKFEEMNI